jgi:hypothetical protein
MMQELLLDFLSPLYSFILQLILQKFELQKLSFDSTSSRQFRESYYQFTPQETSAKNTKYKKLITEAIARLNKQRQETFSYDNYVHTNLLHTLWSNLRPDVRRSTNSWVCDDWGELGFQGKDPSSDFRGMGVLGLAQLTYFSQNYGRDSIKLLQSSQFDYQYFPFAATGINITALILDLLIQHRLDDYITGYLDHLLPYDPMELLEEGYTDEKCVQMILSIVHDIYCQVFIAFGEQWFAARPKDLMEFPRIFKDFKQQAANRYEVYL